MKTASTPAPLIKPTVGRVVWFYPGEMMFRGFNYDSAVPMAAIIVFVQNDRMVNLHVMDHAGAPHGVTSIPLHHGDEVTGDGGPRCEWMPFQRGQAQAQAALQVPSPSPQEGMSAAAAIMGVHKNTRITRPTMSFSDALEALKSGARIARRGWNGKGMWIYLNKGALDTERFNFASTMDGIPVGLFEACDKGIVTRLPNINMRAASGFTVTGWLASQADMLANDWIEVE